ncbi:MAG: tRNA epoxyqueuosine(34) reductase QueG [Holophagaceae bacterium]|nr:tRNA epoxyqueuosine(34) reductase QueG [Holophagaceae bacterium]
MDDPAFKEWLRAEALALGFARVGFASCEPFEAERGRLQAWFSEGGATHLPYLDAETLFDPQRVMEGARTALVGFFPYARPDAVPGAEPGSLKLSRYLWGTDYHILLKPRLQNLLKQAQEQRPGLRGRVCVDTAPLMERQMAVRAGLGWQGKHTLLIMGKQGSWGFLAVLLLDAELPPDQPFSSEHCGSCTACIDACPSQAIMPFRLDPNRCMTTFTIETEAEPPPEVAAAIARSGWAAGCDICQEVCPWNASPIFGDAGLWGHPNRLHTEPAASLRLGPSQWRARTRRTALRRVRVRHWIRTLDLILGSAEHGAI